MAGAREYIGRSAAARQTYGNPFVDSSDMSKAQLSKPCKRRSPEQNPLQSPPPSNQQKRQHHSAKCTEPTEFWDSLSKVWLTRRALRELSRRNTSQRSSQPQAHRPIIRASRAKRKNIRQRISTADFLRHCAPSCLEDIKQFARHGGPDLTDIIGYPEPNHRTMSSSRSSSHRKGTSSSIYKTKSTAKSTATPGKTKSSRTAKSSPYDANFEQNHIDAGVYQYGYEYPDGSIPPLADNYNAVIERLAQHRPSLSPSRFSDEGRQDFVRKDAAARREQNVKTKVLPALLNAIGASEGAEDDVPFTHITPFTDNNTKAIPDYYYGAQPEQLDQEVRDKLSGYIVPQPTYPIAPNFFLEAKGPNGSAVVALRRACHDGAIGARAIHSLQNYGQENQVYDNNIQAISSIYYAGTLKIYGHFAAQPNGPGTQPEYYMNQLRSFAMTDDQETFLKGATAFKNAMDLTKEYRDTAIAHANYIAARPAEDDEEVDKEEEDRDTDDGETMDDDGDDDYDDDQSADNAHEDVALHSFAHRNTNASTLTKNKNDGRGYPAAMPHLLY